MENCLKGKKSKVAALSAVLPRTASIHSLYGKITTLCHQLIGEGCNPKVVETAQLSLFEEVGAVLLATALNELDS